MFPEVCLKLLDFIFYYTWLIDIEAAFLLEEEAQATFFSCKKIESMLVFEFHRC